MMKKIRNIWRLETNQAYGPVKQLYIMLQFECSWSFFSTRCARAFLLYGFAVFLLFFSQTDGFSRISHVLTNWYYIVTCASVCFCVFPQKGHIKLGPFPELLRQHCELVARLRKAAKNGGYKREWSKSDVRGAQTHTRAHTRLPAQPAD